MKIKYNPQNLKWYLILIPFLYPRGFSEYFILCKQIMTCWLYIAIAGIAIYFVFRLGTGRIKINSVFASVLLYFGVMLIETLLMQGGVNEGLQKVFATPALFMFFLTAFQYQPANIMVSMANILLIDNFLNCTIFCPPMLEKIMGENYITNICFIGHVQMCAQIGVLGIAVAYLVQKYGYKKRAIVLYTLSLGTMVFSGAIASYIAFGIILIAYIFYNWGGRYILAKPSPKLIFLFGTALQAVMIPIVIFYRIDFGARYYVWIDAVRQLASHYLTGFGVYGVLIHTFWMEWTGDLGMNYAHNEVLQILLDGGIILFCCYFVMCFSLIKRYSLAVDRKTRYWFNCFLILYMAVGVTDSVTEYNYYYIFLLLMLFLPKLSRNLCSETRKLEITNE